MWVSNIELSQGEGMSMVSPVQAQDAGRLHIYTNIMPDHGRSRVCMVCVHVLCNGGCELRYWVGLGCCKLLCRDL